MTPIIPHTIMKKDETQEFAVTAGFAGEFSVSSITTAERVRSKLLFLLYIHIILKYECKKKESWIMDYGPNQSVGALKPLTSRDLLIILNILII